MTTRATALAQQCRSMIRKNGLLQRRNLVATGTQLLIGVFFLMLLYFMGEAIKSVSVRSLSKLEVRNPLSKPAGAFPICTPAPGADCYSFVWAPAVATTPLPNAALHSHAAMESLVRRMLSLAGLPLPDGAPFGARRFDNTTALDSWLLQNENHTKAAVLFSESGRWNAPLPADAPFRYTLQVNSTRECEALTVLFCKNILMDVAIPLQLLVDSALLAEFGERNDTRIAVSFADFPHPDLPSNFDVVERYGTLFMFIAVTFNFVIQLSLLVQEKEDHLLDAMRQMGLTDFAHYGGWLVIDTGVNLAMVLSLIVAGHAFHLEFFKENSTGLIFFSFWLPIQAFTALAIFFASFIKTAATARVVGIGIYVFTFVAAPLVVLLVILDPREDYESLRPVLNLIPAVPFFIAVQRLITLSAGATELGLGWEDRLTNMLPEDSSNAVPQSFTVEDSWLLCVAAFFMWSALGWYIEKIVPTSNGYKFPWYFPLLSSFWRPQRVALRDKPDTVPPEVKKYCVKLADGSDADVLAEADMIRTGNYGQRKPAVLLYGLTKRFKETTAVDALSYAIDRDQCFVLLGHNGAGKTTTLNMLTGLTNVSEGDAYVFGRSVKHEINAIRRFMGVCPQHDVLWPQLTGREHLEVFAAIKGVPVAAVAGEVDRRLADVDLTSAQNVPAGLYSGGMKRRLSIAIALLGDPKIVYLDEPTTGMDPVTRRATWNMIARAKKGRVIVLTTHSMEEADVLGDRIAVMSHGRLQAIGSSLRLKNRFGAGYRMMLFASSEAVKKRVVSFMDSEAPCGTRLASDIEGALLYQLPRELENPAERPLANFFKSLEEARHTLGYTDFSVGLTTLEEVFLNLSKEDGFISRTDPSGDRQHSDLEGCGTGAITTSTQFVALFRKSVAFQCNSKLSCCCVVMFPVVIMLALMAVELALFNSLRLEVVCGPDIASKEECNDPLADGVLDLECLESLFAVTVPSLPTLTVGKISRRGRFGGVNPNCDKHGCFKDLEYPDYRSIPISFGEDANAMGQLWFGDNSSVIRTEVPRQLTEVEETLFTFRANVAFTMANETCELNYEPVGFHTLVWES